LVVVRFSRTLVFDVLRATLICGHLASFHFEHATLTDHCDKGSIDRGNYVSRVCGSYGQPKHNS
jgi:hypothetical protein